MAEQQKFKIKLPDWLDDDELEEAADDIIQYIIDRTQGGNGIRENGRRYSFPEYSESYKKFKGGGRVDLTLNDEMLRAMELLDVKGRELEIGYESGSELNARAEGNQLGAYGGRPNPKKARRFLGLNREELNLILAKFKD